MAQVYPTWYMSTDTLGAIQQTFTTISTTANAAARSFARAAAPLLRALAPLWTNFRERDRYELARIPRVPIVEVPPLRRLSVPPVPVYALRINAAGRPGRRRRRLAVA